MVDLDYLRATNILRLQAAARKAGLAFKNGSVDKAGLIERLSHHPMIAGATIAILKREDREGPAPTQPVRKPDVADWLDDEADKPRAPQPPALVPNEPASVQGENFGDWRPRMASVENATRTHGDKLAEHSRAIISIDSTLPMLSETSERLARRITELEARRPLEIRIGEKPPVKLEGSTHRQLPDLLAWLSTIKRVILTGPAGTGKSRAAAQCAEALGLEFHLQTPFTQAYEFLGHRDAQGNFHETPTFRAFVHGGVLLHDEADSCAPDAYLSANPILDGNGFAMFGDGKLYKQHPDFHVILNMNTTGDGASMAYSGRNPLDGATIARFGGMLHWEVDANLEASMAQGEGQFYKAVLAVRALMQQRGILTVNATPRHVLIGASLLRTEHFQKRREFILASCLKNGAVAEVWNDVLRLPDVASFLRG